VRAAVAYFGTGGSKLLPLRRGDQLIVDMSMGCVRAGATNPHEVKKLLRRGVQVFSRPHLHAKFIIIDRVVIAGSSNVSRHAKNVLDEAALATDDASALARAVATFNDLCTEPVRKDYLKQCIDAYRPPRITGGAARNAKRRGARQGKLWIIGGLRYVDIPASEQRHAEKVVKKASRNLLDFERTEVDYIHFPSKRPFSKRLREGDWAIQCVRSARTWEVWAPMRFLGLDDYPRGRGKRRYLLLFEKATSSKPVGWSAIRRATKRVAAVRSSKPRTAPVATDAEADVLLRLWDSRGRFRKRNKT
jgi:hypothetical protein